MQTTDGRVWDAMAELAHCIEQLGTHARQHPQDPQLTALAEALDNKGTALAQTLYQPAPPVAGDGPTCDTCGRWSSDLVQGMCDFCRTHYHAEPAAAHGACCGNCPGGCEHVGPQCLKVIA